MKTFNVIAIGGYGIVNLICGFVNTRNEKPRGYMEPASNRLEVDEEEKKVYFNGGQYKFEGYRGGIHGYAIVVRFEVSGVLMDAYTDTPAHSGASSEGIRESLSRRKEDPNSGY